MGEEGVNYVVDGIRGYKLSDKIPCLMRCSGQVIMTKDIFLKTSDSVADFLSSTKHIGDHF